MYFLTVVKFKVSLVLVSSQPAFQKAHSALIGQLAPVYNVM